jgi:hypothetical protein
MNLDWTKSKKRIVNSILYSANYNNGVSTMYTSITDWVGIKLFPNLNDRDFAYYHQRHFHKEGIAPRTGGRFTLNNEGIKAPLDLKFFASKKIYGYITERAKIKTLSEDEVEYIHSVLLASGAETYDVTTMVNVGRLRTDRPVCIDFDPVTMGARSYEFGN